MPEKIHKEFCCPTWYEDNCHCKESIESSRRAYEWNGLLLNHHKKQWSDKHKALVESEADLKLFKRLYHEADKKLRKIDSIVVGLRESRAKYEGMKGLGPVSARAAYDECLDSLEEFILYV